MSEICQIGDTAIRYDVRRSSRVRRKRIEVTPTGVVVIVPAGTKPDKVRAYVESRRRWIFDAVQEIDTRYARRLAQRYASGAKFQYKGRWLMLQIDQGPVDEVQVHCRSKFLITVPRNMPAAERPTAIRSALEAWLWHQADRTIRRAAARYAAGLNLPLPEVRLSGNRHRWGSCDAEGILRIHKDLIQAPVAALEYVVAHEVAHLIHRHHDPAFWNTLSRAMPDWPERKNLLERWEIDRRTL